MVLMLEENTVYLFVSKVKIMPCMIDTPSNIPLWRGQDLAVAYTLENFVDCSVFFCFSFLDQWDLSFVWNRRKKLKDL